MSIVPLQISVGRKVACVAASWMTIVIAWAAALIANSGLDLYLIGEDEQATSSALIALLVVVVAAALGQLLIRVGLGRFRTGGSVARFARYQVAGFGIGTACGIGISPLFHGAGVAGWTVGLLGALLVLALSLLPFRPARHRPLAEAPLSDLVVAPGTVVAHWDWRWPVQGWKTAQVFMVEYEDERRHVRHVAHLYQQPVTELGVVGQVEFARDQPDRVLRFSVEDRRRPPGQGRLAWSASEFWRFLTD